MEFLSCIVGLCLAWMVIQAFHLIPRSKANARKLPPGPKPLPVIGNLLDLGDKPHKSLAKLAMAHGPIMSLKLGRLTTIVISSPSTAKEVLQTHDHLLCNRTIPDAVRVHQHDEYSLPWMPVSTRWRNLRKLCNVELFANKVLDDNQYLRRKKVQELLAEAHQSSLTAEAVDIGKAAFKTSLNLLSNTSFSMDFEGQGSEKTGEMKELISSCLEYLGKSNIADFFQVLKKIDPQGIRRHMEILGRKLTDIFARIISERLQSREVSGSIKNKDFLEILIGINEENREKMDKKALEHFFSDLFSAGTDTTSSTLEWAVAELLHNPEVMSKAKLELAQVIGKDHPVEESDIARLPYLQAIVKETLRLHPPTPLLIPRKAAEDVEINGYIIPKGAQVLVNAWAIGRDLSSWENANSFMPERFLGSNIDVKGRNFELIPFGGGSRVCPGLSLAIRMLHLMLGSLIHTFDWRLEDGVKPEDMNMEDKFGLTLQKAQRLRVVPVQV